MQTNLSLFAGAESRRTDMAVANVEASSAREQQIREDLVRRGFSVEKRGNAWRIRKPGTDISVADLSVVTPGDLRVYRDIHRSG